MNSSLEKKLVSCSLRADKSAYARLVKAYSARVFAICVGMVGHREDAEDIAQQAFLKGFADIGQLRDCQQFGAWVSRIAKNLCIDHIRKRKREIDFGRQVAAQRSTSSEYAELQEALAKLAQEERLVLMLYYFDGRSTRDVAQVLGMSAAAVQKRMSRARKQLRKLLEAGKNA